MPLENAEEIFLHLKDETRVVVIDEGQFLGDELVAVAYGLGRVGKRVIVGGLDADFRGVPFPAMSRLMLSANEVYHPTARCEVCDGPATRTQRLKVVEGGTRPADYSEPIIVVGDKAGVEEGPKEPTDVYEPRCMDHHEVPNPRHLDFDPSHVRSFLGLDGEISVRTLPVHEMWRQVEILLRAPTSIAPEELPKLRERLKPYLEKLP
jgi:thymidine kinase